MSAVVDRITACKCDCFECSVTRHDICRYQIKCIRRPWQQRPQEDT
jgi:hypothetical protein